MILNKKQNFTWPTKKLDEITCIQSGFGFPMIIQGKKDDEVPFYKVSDMNLAGNETEMVVHNNAINRSQCKSLRYKPAPAGTIIFPKIGAAIATNKKRILTRESLYDNNVMGLIPSSNVLSKYLYFWTLTFNISLWASESMPPSIKKSTVEKSEIPLPPFKIQKQIVERLDKIAEAQKLNDDLIQKSDEFFQSLLHKELNPAGKDWEEKMMVDIAEARSGFGFPLDLQGDKNEVLPFYKVSDMNLAGNEIEMKSHNNSISVAKGKKLKCKPAPAGSVIFPKIGAAVATNKKRILVRNSLYDNNVMALIPNKLVNPSFLYYWLIKFDISQWASQSMPPSIKKTAVEKYKILIPPLKTQKQIVEKLSAAQNYKTQLLAQKSKLKELFDSVLNKSMKGQLNE